MRLGVVHIAALRCALEVTLVELGDLTRGLLMDAGLAFPQDVLLEHSLILSFVHFRRQVFDYRLMSSTFLHEVSSYL